MVMFETRFQKYTVGGREPVIGAIRRSNIRWIPVFDLRVTFINPAGQLIYDTVPVCWHGDDDTYLLNGKTYVLKSDRDIIDFRAIVEAAYLEDILDGKDR